jgi:hypothetical protein
LRVAEYCPLPTMPPSLSPAASLVIPGSSAPPASGALPSSAAPEPPLLELPEPPELLEASLELMLPEPEELLELPEEVLPGG